MKKKATRSEIGVAIEEEVVDEARSDQGEGLDEEVNSDSETQSNENSSTSSDEDNSNLEISNSDETNVDLTNDSLLYIRVPRKILLTTNYKTSKDSLDAFNNNNNVFSSSQEKKHNTMEEKRVVPTGPNPLHNK
ncbi:hypothetical protein LWI29_034659 [Acer saccharum]|uniref:Uncharacterized protein n=1 Tax=Acer saccharum TaxID=4024 RepID=A0AA39RFW6_ACESA|nr:hypothetical protein LWI29_034659 [Acer saccharum]